MLTESIIGKSDTIQLCSSSLHCDGMKVTSIMKQDSEIFLERPFMKMQSIPNKQHCLCCSFCLRFIGNASLQFMFLSKELSREMIQKTVQTGESFRIIDFLDHPCHHYSDIKLCQNSCGEMYCSSACRAAHWSNSHRLLCTGSISDDEANEHPLILFKTHAIQTNEIFLLVADLFANICVLTEEAPLRAEEVMSIYSRFVRLRWEECVVSPRIETAAKLRKTIINLVHESWTKLSKALKLKERHLHTVLTEEYFSRTIGMFEQNNVGIRLENPLATVFTNVSIDSPHLDSILAHLNILVESLEDNDSSCDDDEYADVLDDEVGEEKIESVAKSSAKESFLSAHGHIEAILEQEGLDKLLQPLDGAAFYLAVCKINHSCDPNMYVRYVSDAKAGVCAAATALRDVAYGEELLQSYIDQSMPLEKRQKALKDYGFICTCSKCFAEDNRKVRPTYERRNSV